MDSNSIYVDLKEKAEKLKYMFDALHKQKKKYEKLRVTRGLSLEEKEQFGEVIAKLQNFNEKCKNFIRPRKNGVGKFSVEDYVSWCREQIVKRGPLAESTDFGSPVPTTDDTNESCGGSNDTSINDISSCTNRDRNDETNDKLFNISEELEQLEKNYLGGTASHYLSSRNQQVEDGSFHANQESQSHGGGSAMAVPNSQRCSSAELQNARGDTADSGNSTPDFGQNYKFYKRQSASHGEYFKHASDDSTAASHHSLDGRRDDTSYNKDAFANPKRLFTMQSPMASAASHNDFYFESDTSAQHKNPFESKFITPNMSTPIMPHGSRVADPRQVTPVAPDANFFRHGRYSWTPNSNYQSYQSNNYPPQSPYMYPQHPMMSPSPGYGYSQMSPQMVPPMSPAVHGRFNRQDVMDPRIQGYHSHSRVPRHTLNLMSPRMPEANYTMLEHPNVMGPQGFHEGTYSLGRDEIQRGPTPLRMGGQARPDYSSYSEMQSSRMGQRQMPIPPPIYPPNLKQQATGMYRQEEYASDGPFDFASNRLQSPPIYTGMRPREPYRREPPMHGQIGYRISRSQMSGHGRFPMQDDPTMPSFSVPRTQAAPGFRTPSSPLLNSPSFKHSQPGYTGAAIDKIDGVLNIIETAIPKSPRPASTAEPTLPAPKGRKKKNTADTKGGEYAGQRRNVSNGLFTLENDSILPGGGMERRLYAQSGRNSDASGSPLYRPGFEFSTDNSVGSAEAALPGCSTAVPQNITETKKQEASEQSSSFKYNKNLEDELVVRPKLESLLGPRMPCISQAVRDDLLIHLDSLLHESFANACSAAAAANKSTVDISSIRSAFSKYQRNGEDSSKIQKVDSGAPYGGDSGQQSSLHGTAAMRR